MPLVFAQSCCWALPLPSLIYSYVDFPLSWCRTPYFFSFSLSLFICPPPPSQVQMLGPPLPVRHSCSTSCLFLGTSASSSQKILIPIHSSLPPCSSLPPPYTQVLFHQKVSGPEPATFMTTSIRSHLVVHAYPNLTAAKFAEIPLRVRGKQFPSAGIPDVGMWEPVALTLTHNKERERERTLNSYLSLFYKGELNCFSTRCSVYKLHELWQVGKCGHNPVCTRNQLT